MRSEKQKKSFKCNINSVVQIGELLMKIIIIALVNAVADHGIFIWLNSKHIILFDTVD